jgi:hypothetical protein
VTDSEARKLTLFAVLGLVLVALALASGYAMANRYELVAQQEGLWSRGKKDLQPSKSPYLEYLLTQGGSLAPRTTVKRPHEWHSLVYRLDRWTGEVVVLDEDLMMPVELIAR